MSRISNTKAFARLLIVAWIGVSVATSSGCFSGFDMRKNIPWPELVNFDEPKTPLKMVAMWQDTVMSHPGKTAVRGFGGRIIFYGADANKPVKVDGDLDVFAFVERADKTDKTQPDRKFVFTRDQVKEHYSENKLGHTYSFWLPWEPVGGETMHITLIARFTPAEGGGTVTSEQSRYILPGLNPPGSTYADNPEMSPLSQRRGRQNVQQIGYYENAGPMQQPTRRLQSYSIGLPRLNPSSDIGYRLSHSGQAPSNSGVAHQSMNYDQAPLTAEQLLQQYRNELQQERGLNVPVQQQQTQPRPAAGFPNQNRQQHFAPAAGGSPVRTYMESPFSAYNASRWDRFTNAGNGVVRTSVQGPRAPLWAAQNSGSFAELGPESQRWQTTYHSQDPRQQNPLQQAGYHQPATHPAQAGPSFWQGSSQQLSRPALQGQLASPRFSR